MEKPGTVPLHPVGVERDVQYAVAEGFYAHAPVGDMRRALFPGRRKNLRLEMDIYKPEKDDASSRPLLMMMHGGSFLFGSKEEKGQAGWCAHFASLGYVAASIDYRLGFRPRKDSFRQAEYRALDDADAALAYLLGREDLRIDPRKVFVAGTSAGAMTALNLAFRLYGKDPLPEVKSRLPEGFRIRAVANLWGSVHDLTVLEGTPVPILSYQSLHDPVMPYDSGYPIRKFSGITRLVTGRMYGTHAIHEKAIAEGVRAEHHACSEPRHRLHLDKEGNPTSRFYEIRDSMVVFFAGEME